MKNNALETELDISHKLNQYELATWLVHLNRIQTELRSLIKMCSFNIDDEIDSTQYLQVLEEKEFACIELNQLLKAYKKEKPDELLCEESGCDLDLLKTHENYRAKYIAFLTDYRKLKNKIYAELSGKKFRMRGLSVPYS